MKKHLFLLFGFIFVFSINIFAQWNDAGKFNAWTSQTFSRKNTAGKKTPYLREIRTGRNQGFDRLVFEFTGDIPRYQIEYITPPIVGTADEEVKVKGKYFVSINLQSLPYPDDEKLGEVRRLIDYKNSYSLSEISEIEWFEGTRWYVIGLKAKKLFRVQQLKNPTRLVVDFKN